MPEYAKVVVMGSPITKSNFKMHNRKGRAILPGNSGTYHDRYFLYEENIAVTARAQNPGVTFDESLIAVLRVYYKSEHRHPDTNNITKSIFDGIEKSGLIVNDAQIRRIIIEEYYDRIEPRFELELFSESFFQMSYDVRRRSQREEPRRYQPPQNTAKVKLPASHGFSADNLQQIKANMEKRSQARAEQEQAKQSSAINRKEAESQGQAPADKSAGKTAVNTTSQRSQGKKGDPGTAKGMAICSVCQKAVQSGRYKNADGGRTIICNSCFKKLF